MLYEHCATCHHAGGAGPFSLVTYPEVRKRLRAIVSATSAREMPPWQPETSWGHFLGERRLTDAQIAVLKLWSSAGAPEGSVEKMPAVPVWNDGWQLGPPDLIVSMERPYELPADGRDVYRNFVMSAPTGTRRFVRAVEIHPGNLRVVHHGFLLLDRTGQCRQRADQETDWGFDGMSAGGAGSPQGHFLSWQPGKTPRAEPASRAWVLEAGTDLVLQLHMRPSGKPETVQAKVGLYFSDQPPTELPYLLMLRSTSMDIPPGATDYPIESSYTLPVDADALAVLPHTHYLGKELKAWAELPDGRQQPLLWIKQWDFNWQGDYTYAEPVPLPKGTAVHMRYTYDNSRGNPQNPHDPPRRVTYGLETDDEMGELWLKLLPHSPKDTSILAQEFQRSYGIHDSIGLYEALLRKDPTDQNARVGLAKGLYVSGDIDSARREFRQIVEVTPENIEAWFSLSVIYLRMNRMVEAKHAMTTALRFAPNDFRILDNLGLVLLKEGKPAEAIPLFERALKSNPNDTTAAQHLEQAKMSLGK